MRYEWRRKVLYIIRRGYFIVTKNSTTIRMSVFASMYGFEGE